MIEKMYIGMKRLGPNRIRAIRIGTTQDAVVAHAAEVVSPSPPQPAPINSFRGAMEDYISHLDGVESSVPLLMTILPLHSGAMAEQEIYEESRRRGIQVSSDGEDEIFEIDVSDYPYFRDKARQLRSLSSFSHVAPGIFLVGLVSIYDAYLGHLLRAVFEAHPERVDSSDRKITFEQIRRFSTIEDAREHIIRKEVEAILRDGHAEQVEWLERQLNMPLRKGLDCWSDFIEICERRNLWTHNKGIVSQQYLDVCRRHGCEMGDVKLGDQLPVSAKYFQNALEVFYELGIKLGQTLWRKISLNDLPDADGHLIEAGFNLTKLGRYRLASELLAFGCGQKKHADDSLRRKLVVNWANATKLGGNKELALDILSKEDWSAVDDIFQLCVHAVRDDVEAAVLLMRKVCKVGGLGRSELQNWPVFETLRRTEEFKATYLDLFGDRSVPLLGDGKH